MYAFNSVLLMISLATSALAGFWALTPYPDNECKTQFSKADTGTKEVECKTLAHPAFSFRTSGAIEWSLTLYPLENCKGQPRTPAVVNEETCVRGPSFMSYKVTASPAQLRANAKAKERAERANARNGANRIS